MSSQLIPRIGTRPIIVAGALIAAAGMYYLSRVPVHGSYLTDLLPGLVVMSIGLGAVFVTVTTAANAGVPADQAGLAAGLLNTSLQLGSALGLAIFSAIATARTNHLLADHATHRAGAHRRASDGHSSPAAIALLAAAVIALRATNTRGNPPQPSSAPILKPAPVPETM